MNLNEVNKIEPKSETLRMVVIFFGLFMALMLFQTPYLNLGTIAAVVSIVLTILAFLLQKHNRGFVFRFGLPNLILLAFLLYSVLITVANGYDVPSPERYITQILLCILMFSVTLNRRETDFLRMVFVLASTVYAILTIYAIITNPIDGRIHTHVILFNAEIDPNFIGLPFVSTLGLCLDSILNKRKQIFLHIICFLISALAIVYTASRGSMLGAILICSLVLIAFLLNSSVSAGKKFLMFLLVLVAIVVLWVGLSALYADQWNRMTHIGIGNDGGRLALWKQAIESWEESPIFGRGLNHHAVQFNHVTHNTFLQILSETGLIGFAFFALFLSFVFRRAFRAGSEYFFVLLALFVQIMFLDALTTRVLWVVLSWMVMLPKKQKTGEWI